MGSFVPVVRSFSVGFEDGNPTSRIVHDLGDFTAVPFGFLLPLCVWILVGRLVADSRLLKDPRNVPFGGIGGGFDAFWFWKRRFFGGIASISVLCSWNISPENVVVALIKATVAAVVVASVIARFRNAF